MDSWKGDGWMEVGMDGWMNRWMEVGMDKWMDGGRDG